MITMAMRVAHLNSLMKLTRTIWFSVNRFRWSPQKLIVTDVPTSTNVIAVIVVVPETSWKNWRVTIVTVPLMLEFPPGVETKPTKKLPQLPSGKQHSNMTTHHRFTSHIL
jgi:hypothetical protein